jgi:hypothetical protein
MLPTLSYWCFSPGQTMAQLAQLKVGPGRTPWFEQGVCLPCMRSQMGLLGPAWWALQRSDNPLLCKPWFTLLSHALR